MVFAGKLTLRKKLVEEEVVIKMKNNHHWLLQNFSTGSGVKKKQQNSLSTSVHCAQKHAVAVGDTPVVFSSR